MLSYQIIKAFFVKEDYISRLRRYTNVEEAHEEKRREKTRDSGHILRDAFFKKLGKIKFLESYKRRVQMNLTKAHLPLRAEEFIALNLILFFVLAFLLLAINWEGNWIAAILAGIAAGWALPSFVVKHKIKKRSKLFNEQLADAISMISGSLKTGYSFMQAVDMVVEEMSGPIAEEFDIFKKEINLGQNTEKAFENMITRIPDGDLELLITAVLIQRQVGGNLSEVLDNIADTIRDRVRIKRELRIITAQGKISGIVISILPVILCLMLYLINPAQMTILFTRAPGQVMIGAAIVMELVGIFAIRRVVRIDI